MVLGGSPPPIRISHTGAVNRLLATLALAVFLGALILIALKSTDSDGGGSAATTDPTRTATRTRPTTTAPKQPVRLKLAAVGAFDPPPGDGRENDADIPKTVDGDPATFWSTEHYTNGFFKKGVGFVLDAGRRRTFDRVLVGTDGTGASVEIRIGNNPNGPFRVVSANRALSGTTAFAVKKGATGRYVLVWVTTIPPATGEAHITEVRAFG